MDLAVHRPQSRCAATGRPLVPGEVFYSVLRRGRSAVERLDIAAESWSGPPEQAIAWWRSRYPQPGSSVPALAPADVLLDALERLEDGDDAALRYLLALQLVRRRILRIVDDPVGGASAGPGDEVLTLACRRRDRDYRVRTVTVGEAAATGVEERLAALLWSGEAA